MIQRWLRVPLFPEEFHCPCCSGIVDIYGDHCVSCEGGGDRTRRHNLIRNEVYHYAASAGQTPELEKPGLLRPRPIDGTISENGTLDHTLELRAPRMSICQDGTAAPPPP